MQFPHATDSTNQPSHPHRDAIVGSLVGLAVGDAVGTTNEFTSRGSVQPIDDMVGGGPFLLQPGQWTDDTSMALCIAHSIAETATFNFHDQMERYTRWYRDGYLSSTGTCFDIGGQTASALRFFHSTGSIVFSTSSPNAAGNGSLMRLAPVPAYFHHDREQAATAAAASSLTTHPAAECVAACAVFADLVVTAYQGATKQQLIDRAQVLAQQPLPAKIAAILQGSYLAKTIDEISTSGYVVHTLEAALWALHHTDNFRDGLLTIVNLGEDADTVGAVYGQIAGAFYGLSGIPSEWVEKTFDVDSIVSVADKLIALGNDPQIENDTLHIMNHLDDHVIGTD